MKMKLEKLPLITLTILFIASLISIIPGANTALEFTRATGVTVDKWRLFTHVLPHWSFDHLLWDGLAFLAAGAVLERSLLGTNWRARIGLLISLILGALATSLATLEFYPWVLNMRGLSGLCVQLYTSAAVIMLISGIRERARFEITLGAGALLLLVGKILFEELTGSAMFAATGGFTVLVHAHVIGSTIGAIFGVIEGKRIDRRSPSRDCRLSVEYPEFSHRLV